VSPNPFSATVRIQFQQGLNANSRVSVYDRAGNKVNELTVSNNEVVWNGTDANGRKLTAGVYLLKAEGAQGASARVVISR
jgi:flagellar hook assembly protein FlgD